MDSVLVIGNSKSIWMKEYIKHIYAESGNRIFITDYYGLSDEEDAYYDNLGVSILRFSSNNKILRFIKCAKVLHSFSKENRGHVKVLDIQSPPHSIQAYLLACMSRFLKTKTIVTFWGSDILTLNKKEAERLKTVLDECEHINIGTKHMHDKLRAFYGDVYDDRCRHVKFGSPAIDAIRELDLPTEKCKEFFGINKELITIAIGYNGRKEQQHIEVLDQLAKLGEPIKERIQIVLHLAYGLEVKYKAIIEEAALSSGISYKVLDDFYDLKTIAILRKATDVLIHAQTSDGLSGSIRESIYAGAILINPSWIRYDSFDDEGIEYIKYDSFDEIAEIIIGIIEGKITINKEKNKALIYKGYSWEAVRGKWVELING